MKTEVKNLLKSREEIKDMKSEIEAAIQAFESGSHQNGDNNKPDKTPNNQTSPPKTNSPDELP
jgi:hypothetical protein